MRTLAILSGVVIISLAATSLHYYQQAARGQILFNQVATIIDRRYVDSLGSNAVYEKASNGLVEQLNDPYSELMSPKDIEEFQRGTLGLYGGIGAIVETRTGDRTFIQRVYPNTPAERGGVQAGDEIIAVDSVSTVGFELARVTALTRGVPGTKVKVTFLREGVAEPIVLSMTRAEVHIPAVPFALMLEPGIGYVPLQTFNETSAEEVQSAVDSLLRSGARSLILDLRSNPGGILGQALSISSLFLRPGQPLVEVRRRNGAREVDSAMGPRLNSRVPLVVLTDEGSASASEIVAGALQDHDRALVIGTRTYGKGLVQETFPLEGDYLLKVTTGKWYTPSGRTIHRDRIMQPDGRYVEVPVDTVKKPLPKYSSDSGRTLLGGGGIMPDVRLEKDTLSTAEQNVYRALAPQASLFNTLMIDEALKHKASVKPDFVVQPEWLTEVNRKLDSAGVKIDEKAQAARQAVMSRELGRRIARSAFGDAGAALREFPLDNQLMKAVSLLRGKSTQSELFAAAR
jgi:carboxyl-terminal processing protease